MKKLGFLFATVIMIMLFAFSTSAATEGYYTYEVENSEATITDVDTSVSGDITIPSTLGGCSVTSIGRAAFMGCHDITSIVIPDSVTFTDDYAFHYCTNLVSVTIGNGLTSIGYGLFLSCTSLTNVTLSNNVTTIEGWAFRDCSALTSIIIPDGVSSMGQSVFYGCTNLTSITIPNSVKSIGYHTFIDCINLADVYYGGTEKQWDEISFYSYDICLLNATIHFNCCTVNSNGKHVYTSKITTPATHLIEGIETFTCSCGDTYNEPVEKITEHTYEKSVTEPTCVAKGYTTYTCACGESYTEYSEKLPHSFDAVVTEPTCTAGGYTTYICECGYTYNDNYINALGHNMGDFIVVKEATCIEKGEERADCLSCDYFKIQKINIKGHIDVNNDEYCDICDLYLPSLDCLCVCHAKTIGAFVYKLFAILDEFFGTRLLERIFHISEYCICGLKH